MALIHLQKPQGMTLLELLVAMTLMVIISAIAYASLNGLIEAKLHTDVVAKNLRHELLTTRQLHKDFAALIQRSSKNQTGTQTDAIVGTYAAVQFNRNGHANPLNLNRAELQKVHWFVRDNVLYRRSLDWLDIGSFGQWQERQYLQNVETISLYYTNSVGQESRTWPIANSQMPIKSIQLQILMQDETVFNYFFTANL